MSSTLPEVIASYLTVDRVVVFPIATLSAMYFVYGFYVLLFGTCIHLMRCRYGDGPETKNLYMWLTIVLFVLSTLYVACYTGDVIFMSLASYTALAASDYMPFVDYTRHSGTKMSAIFSFTYLVPVLLNITADYMLIHRCYVIWSSRKRIGVPLLVLSVLTNTYYRDAFQVVGLVASIITAFANSNAKYMLFVEGDVVFAAYRIASAIVNSVITLLTAGRIWWIHRQALAHDVHASDRLVQSVSRIIMESGVLYPMFSIITLIVSNTAPTAAFNFSPLKVLTAGIAPTLILVRAKLGKTVETAQDMVSDIRFTSQPIAREMIAGRSHSRQEISV